MNRLFGIFAGIACLALAPGPAESAADDTALSGSGVAPEAVTKAHLTETLGKLPLSFEANQGQSDPRVKFLARGSVYTLFLAERETVLSIRRASPASQHPLPGSLSETATLRMKLLGANPAPRMSGVEELAGRTNYLNGNDPAKWHTAVPTFGGVRSAGVYPGVDVLYHGSNQRQLEYDFVVAPGADPARIRLRFTGTDKITLEEAGDLVLHTTRGDVIEHSPIIYQEVEGIRKAVGGGYRLLANDEVGFRLAAYRHDLPLVIDPVLTYSTYLSGSIGGYGAGIAVDGSRSAYVMGTTASADFPTVNPEQPVFGGSIDLFVTKLNPQGTAVVYSTYLGGSGQEVGGALAVDSSGAACLTGYTYSPDFPALHSLDFKIPADQFHAYAFVTKLDPSGTALVYSTLLGGNQSSYGYGIAVDSAGSAYVAGQTSADDFLTVHAARSSFGGYNDGFVTKIGPNGPPLVYSTYLGGSGFDAGTSIAVDGSGSAYVTGDTDSADFPTVNAFQPIPKGTFVTKLAPNGSSFAYSTYLGGLGGNFPHQDTFARGIAVDLSGHAYVTGATGSTDFPTQNAYQAVRKGGKGGGLDAFVSKLSVDGKTLVYSTYLGGTADDFAEAIALDPAGRAYITGSTASTDFPIVTPLQSKKQKGIGDSPDDAFVSRLNTSGNGLDFSTYLGGNSEDDGLKIAVDTSGDAYVTGITDSTDFPTRHALQGSSSDAEMFVAKIGGPFCKASGPLCLPRVCHTFGPPVNQTVCLPPICSPSILTCPLASTNLPGVQ